MAEQKYRVIERLEAGGMAEVFRGEAASVQGFRKEVAIKRVLPHLAQNEAFIAMFLDEARLGARLNHANIVTVFDIGSADNTYFIVMEFIDGANLKSVIEGLKRRGQRVPTKHALYICIEACRGLSYAHEATDENNHPLKIVHRDISPPNILMSKRGEIKLTDFGLAKATTQLENTDPGVVKGKFSYLAPETASGEDVDARADIFAIGVVLWEMLAGKRLFLGESDYQTVKLVQQTNIPSLKLLNRDVDDELEELILRALTRDPSDRFQSAREFGDALSGYLFSHQLKVTSYDIANLVKTIAERAKPRQDQSLIDRLIQDELMTFTSLEGVGESIAPGAMPLDPDDVDNDPSPGRISMENPAAWFDDEPGLRDSSPDPVPVPSDIDLLTLEDGGSDEHDIQAIEELEVDEDGAPTNEFALPPPPDPKSSRPPATTPAEEQTAVGEEDEALSSLLEGTGDHRLPAPSSVQSLEQHIPGARRNTGLVITFIIVLAGTAVAGAWLGGLF